MIVFNKGVSKDVTPKTYGIEHDGLMVAMHESYVEFERLNGAIPDAMSACYEMWCLGDKSPEEKCAVLEGTIGDIFGKIKAFFVAIAKKIKEWVVAAINFFRNLIMSDKKFVEKYETMLTTKSTDKFKWSGHKWDVSFLTSDIPYDESKIINPYIEGLNKVDKLTEESVNALKDANKELKDYKKFIDSGMEARSIQDFSNKITKKSRGSKSDNMTFSQISVSSMIDAIVDDDIIKRMEEVADKIQSITDDSVAAVERAGEKIKSDNEGNANVGVVTEYVRLSSSAIRYGTQYLIAGLNTFKTLNGEMRHEFGSVLRSFLRYKPEK